MSTPLSSTSASSTSSPSSGASGVGSSASTEDDEIWHFSYEKRSPSQTFAQKFMKKFKEDPVIPFGVGLTTFALIGGLKTFTKPGSGLTQNKWMWARITFQGITVVAMMYACFKTPRAQSVLGIDKWKSNTNTSNNSANPAAGTDVSPPSSTSK